eukprot:1671957-Pyramimonas_sp.AAC.2
MNGSMQFCEPGDKALEAVEDREVRPPGSEHMVSEPVPSAGSPRAHRGIRRASLSPIIRARSRRSPLARRRENQKGKEGGLEGV